MKLGKSIISAMLAVSVISSLPIIPAYAESKITAVNTSSVEKYSAESKEKNGWYTKDGEKYYFENDKMIKERTKKINGKIYLFGKSGKLLTDGIYTVNDKKYSTDKNGVVATNKWISKKTATTYTRYYYAQSTGAIREYLIKKDKYSWHLYIDGKCPTKDNFPHIDTVSFYKIMNDYCYIGSFTVWKDDG